MHSVHFEGRQSFLGKRHDRLILARPCIGAEEGHGFHVTLGAIMLAVVLYRVMKGHFTPENHFGFEGAAWYWHFVDVVWLGLYVVVYWL